MRIQLVSNGNQQMIYVGEPHQIILNSVLYSQLNYQIIKKDQKAGNTFLDMQEFRKLASQSSFLRTQFSKTSNEMEKEDSMKKMTLSQKKIRINLSRWKQETKEIQSSPAAERNRCRMGNLHHVLKGYGPFTSKAKEKQLKTPSEN